MKITEIETLLVENVAVVCVRTDEGVEGIGQTAPYHADITVDVLHHLLAPTFLGGNPWDLTPLIEDAITGGYRYKFRGTFMYRALCGIDTAIWDLLGKVTGQPVYNLLGGKLRDRIPVYTSSMARDTTPEQEVQRIVDDVKTYGFQCAKIKIGVPMGRDSDSLPGRSEQLVALLRDGVGDHVNLIADANGNYTPKRAIQMGRFLEEYDYYFFEEPCPFEEIENTAQVAAALDIPVAGGEQDDSLPQFARMIQTGAVDVVQPDIGYAGGITRTRKVAEMADAAGIPCTPHCANQSMLQIFTTHVMAAMPACTQYQEYHVGGGPAWTLDIYEPMLTVQDGAVAVPDGPGWGVSLTPGLLKRAERRISKLND